MVSAIPPLGQVPRSLWNCGRGHSLYIPRVLCGTARMDFQRPEQLFFYAAESAAHCNDSYLYPAPSSAAAPRYACLIPSNKIEALAALLSVHVISLWDFPRSSLHSSSMVCLGYSTRWTRRISRSPNGSFYSYWRSVYIRRWCSLNTTQYPSHLIESKTFSQERLDDGSYYQN